MGRPKSGDVSATQKMQETFWQLLAAKPYDQITVSDITRTSGLNRSAFYYHYANIPELADDAIAALYAKTAVSTFIARIIHSPTDATAEEGYIRFISDQDYLASARKVILIAGPHSTPGLVRQLKDFIIEVWLRILMIDPKTLDDVQRVTLEFAVSGILGIFGWAPSAGNPRDIAPLIRQSHIPETIAQLVNSLK
ncbi:TetR/AcrR family transcriptional regulator [Bifidobacterium vespertilionis]|uniref:TetR/AcrR family transcriptional regulator n=1 Tax=Bifidobacterium vespertilionis TaxID=2562524 RepID=UPI001BDCA3B6|nr:TetR/AcrR family transcriptional regulator [Bifidobacterium vespertilionis]MBT1179450.1 TetR/AcrR family transcriptional regulator [Bifidobacterium vespertilionis]